MRKKLVLSLLFFFLPFILWADEPPTISHVVVDTSNKAFVIYYGVMKNELDAIKSRMKEIGDKAKDLEIVFMEDFKKGLSHYVNQKIIRNDYPEYDVALGILRLIQGGLSEAGLGLTWNGGIAFTYNDFRHAEKLYNEYQNRTFWQKIIEFSKKPERPDSKLDPINPENHFIPLLKESFQR